MRGRACFTFFEIALYTISLETKETSCRVKRPRNLLPWPAWCSRHVDQAWIPSPSREIRGQSCYPDWFFAFSSAFVRCRWSGVHFVRRTNRAFDELIRKSIFAILRHRIALFRHHTRIDHLGFPSSGIEPRYRAQRHAVPNAVRIVDVLMVMP